MIDDERRRWCRQQRVAVGRRVIDLFGADIAGSPGAVLDHHRLAPFARQPVGDNPRNGVGRAAGRKWHDDLYRTVWVVTGAAPR